MPAVDRRTYSDIESFMPYAVAAVKRYITSDNIDGLQKFINDLSSLSSDIDSLLDQIPEYLAYYQDMQEKLRQEEEANRLHMQRQKELKEKMESMFGSSGKDDVPLESFFNSNFDFSTPEPSDSLLGGDIDVLDGDSNDIDAEDELDSPERSGVSFEDIDDSDIGYDEFIPTIPTANMPGAFGLTNNMQEELKDAMEMGAAQAQMEPNGNGIEPDETNQEQQDRPEEGMGIEDPSDGDNLQGHDEASDSSQDMEQQEFEISKPEYDDYDDETGDDDDDGDDDEDNEDNIDELLSDGLFI